MLKTRRNAPLDLNNEVWDFYVLLQLSAELWRVKDMHHSTERLKQDIEELLAEHSKNLAAVIFDYLCHIALGEARYSRKLTRLRWDAVILDTNRQQIFEIAPCYSPKQFLPLLVELFTNGDWKGSYGGKPWGKIAQAALNYATGAWNEVIFIDHAIDLAHNGGLCFDKGLIVCDNHRLSEFSDMKRDHHITEWGDLCCSAKVFSLATRCVVLGFLGGPFCLHSSSYKGLVYSGYEPVRWGTTSLRLSRRERIKCGECGEVVVGHAHHLHDGGAICSNCTYGYKQCSVCGYWFERTAKLVCAGGHRFCLECAEKHPNIIKLVGLPHCRRCGSAIPDEPIEVRGELYCAFCAKKKFSRCSNCGEWYEPKHHDLGKCDDCCGPMCGFCGEHTDNGTYVDGVWYCEKCYIGNFSICDSCGESVSTDYLYSTGYDTVICYSCAEELEECSYCSKKWNEEDMGVDKYGDHICKNCLENSNINTNKTFIWRIE